MTRHSVTYTLPEHWSGALINNDWTGLDARDSVALCAFLDAEGLRAADCGGVEEAGFRWRHDATAFCDFPAAGQCGDFAFLVETAQ